MEVDTKFNSVWIISSRALARGDRAILMPAEACRAVLCQGNGGVKKGRDEATEGFNWPLRV